MTTETLTPANAGRVIRKYGGVEVVPVSSPDRGVVLGIFGPGGVGKTTLAASIVESPLGSPALYLDARGNPHVISSYGAQIDIIPLTSYKQQETIRQDMLKDKECPYKTVIIDNVTELFHMDLRDRYGSSVEVKWEMHSATTADILQLVRNWTDMSTGPLKLNVVMVFQEVPETRTIRGQKVESRSEIAFNKALQSQIPTIVNFLGRLYIIEDVPPYRRLLDFRPVETVHQAKFQVDRAHPIAGSIPMEQYNPSLASLVDSMRGGKPWPEDKHAKKSATKA